MKIKVIAISGYFCILHKGHIQYMEEAKKLGDQLIVIVNNNEQQIKKKGKLIQDCKDIKYIIERFSFVDKVIISIDKDESTCETIKSLKPDIVANGGDRHANDIPEYKLCKKLGIKMKFGIGGKKINSSSNILKK